MFYGSVVKLNFRPYIRQYTSPNENFEYGYPLILASLCSCAALFESYLLGNPAVSGFIEAYI